MSTPDDKHYYWSQAAVYIAFWLVVLLMAILFAGSPDLMDAIVARIGATK